MNKPFNFVFLSLTILILLSNGCAPASTPIPPAFTPGLPTATPFVMPTGDFIMSWDTYDSRYNSLGGILTIRRQGTNYTQTLVFSDGSCDTKKLTVISVGEEIELTDRPGNPYGDSMMINSNGQLSYWDKQGIIYSVPPYNSKKSPITECGKP